MQYRQLLLDQLPQLRIRGATPKLLQYSNPPSLECVPFEITPLLPLIDDYFHTHGKRAEGPLIVLDKDAMPPLAVPYEETWWEWRERDEPRFWGNIDNTTDYPLVFGIHLRAHKGAACREAHDALVALERARHPDTDARVDELIGGAEWVLEGALYAAKRHNRPGDAAVIPMRGVIGLARDGRILSHAYDEGRGLGASSDMTRDGQRLVALFTGVLFGMALLSCRNVEQAAVEPPPALSKKRERRPGGRPLVRYHELRIRVPGHKTYYDPGAARGLRDSVPRGLHYVRGHFKTFTAARPLLGKAVGRFYWPPFLRGKAEAGVVGKTYVESPAPESLSLPHPSEAIQNQPTGEDEE